MKKIWILVTVIIFFGSFLRFYDVNWDNFGAFHPDERNISLAVTHIHFFNALNPQFFAYGGLPIYLYRAVGEGVVFITKDHNWLYDWGHITVVGRYVSATLSSITIALIFFVGALYFSPAVGVVSAFLLAVSPWAVEQAHFDTTETMLAFFVLLILIIAKKITVKRIFLLGIVWGLAMAAKTTAILFGVIPFFTIMLPDFPKKIWQKIFQLFLVGSTTGVCFFLFSPYTLLDFKDFYTSMTYESGVALGRFSVPYTLQFWHTTPYLYPIITMLWQAGPVVIVGLAGLIAMLIQLFQKPKQFLPFLIFPLVYFAWVGDWYTKFSRYNVPFLPFVTIAAAWLMIDSLQKLKRFSFWFYISYFVYSLICLLTLLWGLANFTVYLRPQTKDVATNWIVAHIPQTAKLYTEHWNDGLPLDWPGVPNYNRELLTVYDLPDDNTKIAYYGDKLPQGDYIILSTRRIWATMPRLTDKYPVTSLFYKKLLAGELGYTEVATFTSYPQLFGIQINDDSAEESIQVFDHPTVRIFQNTAHFSKAKIISLLTP